MIERITKIRKNFEDMPLESIKTWKVILIFAIITILFGGWWYLDLKKLSGALLIVCLLFLAVFLYLEQKKSPEPSKNPKKHQTKHSPETKFEDMLPKFEFPKMEKPF